MTPEQYQEQQSKNARHSDNLVTILAGSSALVGEAQTVASLADAVAIYKQGAVDLADAFTSATLGASPLGLLIGSNDRDRLADVFGSLFRDSAEAEWVDRARRIARSEPMQAAWDTSHQVMKTHGIADYRWINDPDPCPICVDLAARLHSIDEIPNSHPRCECVTVPANN